MSASSSSGSVCSRRSTSSRNCSRDIGRLGNRCDLFDLDRLGRYSSHQADEGARGVLPGWTQPAVVGCRTIGHGDAAQRHHDGRHDGAGIRERDALPAVLLRPAAGDDRPVSSARFFHNAKVYTAYEYLERRFDAKTRAFTSLLFLISRSMSLGVVISAPAVVFSVILGLDLTTTVLLIGAPAVIYTIFGGVQAVRWVDVKQMGLIVGGLIAAVVLLIAGLPAEVSVAQALRVAGAAGRLQIFDFSFDLTNQYTFWSGTIAALFLFCSYFGTDQSQVQRYLATSSVDSARQSLMISAYWKIPLQALVLLVGVFLFLFFLYTPSPMLFNGVHQRDMREGPHAGEYRGHDSLVGAARACRFGEERGHECCSVSLTRITVGGGKCLEIRGGAFDDQVGSRPRQAQFRDREE